MCQIGDHRKCYFCAGFKKDGPGLIEVAGSVPIEIDMESNRANGI
jgi:hypothetical protein